MSIKMSLGSVRSVEVMVITRFKSNDKYFMFEFSLLFQGLVRYWGKKIRFGG
jgi:hypothetical protein